MMVFFDHQAFCIQEYGGLSRYYTELIAGLQGTGDVTPLLPLGWSNNRHLQNAGLHSRPFFANRQFRGKQNLLYAVNRWNDIHAIKKQSFDVFHATYYDPYFLPYLNDKKKRTPIVVTFLDMIHEKLGHQFPYLAQDKAIVQNKRLLAHRADRLIAVSESTKRDVVETLDVDPAKIDVIYHGSSFPLMTPLSEKQSGTSGNPPYLLFVGLRRGYKNFDGMLYAIGSVLKTRAIRLICAGGGAFSAEEQGLIRSLGVVDWVTQQSVTDEQLRKLYQNAQGFIFPSFCEGFGIPILEAFSCGCPCLLSNGGSLPEIGGEAALYFDPDQPETLVLAIEQLLTHSMVRETLASLGQKRVGLFSWSIPTQQTIQLYQSMT